MARQQAVLAEQERKRNENVSVIEEGGDGTENLPLPGYKTPPIGSPHGSQGRSPQVQAVQGQPRSPIKPVTGPVLPPTTGTDTASDLPARSAPVSPNPSISAQSVSSMGAEQSTSKILPNDLPPVGKSEEILTEREMEFVRVRYHQENETYEQFKRTLSKAELNKKHRLLGRVKRLRGILTSRNRLELNRNEIKDMETFIKSKRTTETPVGQSPPRAESTMMDITTTSPSFHLVISPPTDVSAELTIQPNIPVTENISGTPIEMMEYHGIEQLIANISVPGVTEPPTHKRRHTNGPKRIPGGLSGTGSTTSIHSTGSAASHSSDGSGNTSRKRPLETTAVSTGQVMEPTSTPSKPPTLHLQ